MKKLTTLVTLLLLTPLADAGQTFIREYGRASTISFDLFATDGTISISESDGGTDAQVFCGHTDETGTDSNSDYEDEGRRYSLALTAEELECDPLIIQVDATVYENLYVETCGSPNATHMLCPGGGYLTGGTSTSASNTTTQTQLDTSLSFADGDLVGYLICQVEDVTSGDPKGQCKPITVYAGTSDTATHAAFISALPQNGEYIVKDDPRSVQVCDASGICEVNVVEIEDLGATAQITEYADNVSSMDAGVITSSVFETGAIDANAAATNFIGSDELADAAAQKIIDEFETQSQADPTGFQVNVKEVDDTAQTGNDNGADINAILADTNELQTDDIPGDIAALNDLSAAEVNAEVDTGLSDIHLDHLFAVAFDSASPPGSATSFYNELTENDGGLTRFTANALEQGPSGGGGGASAAAIADAVWDELQNEHATAGSFGETATEIASILDDTGTSGVALTPNSITSGIIAANAIGASEIADDAIGAGEIAADAIGASEIASNAIGSPEIAADAIGSSELAESASTEIWGISCEDQGSGYSCREVMSLLLAEAMGTCTYTTGTRTWSCADPSGGETRFTLIYGTDLDGDRTSSTPTPFTP